MRTIISRGTRQAAGEGKVKARESQDHSSEKSGSERARHKRGKKAEIKVDREQVCGWRRGAARGCEVPGI